jgi:Zn-dependent protease
LRGSFAIARVFGIPIRIDPSWFLTLSLVVGILALQILPAFSPGDNAGSYWVLGLVGGIVFFASIVLHELGHSVVARYYGIPVIGITLFIFGGVSQLGREPQRPKVESLMAAAGPAVSLLLGVLFLGIRFFLVTGDSTTGWLIEWLGQINIVLGVFNLLPGFPMDGGRLLRSAIWGASGSLRVATRAAGWLGRGLAIVMIAGGALLTAISILSSFGAPVSPVTSGTFDGPWLIVIGLFLERAAGQTQIQTRILDILKHFRADQLVSNDMPIVPAEATIREILYQQPFNLGQSACFVLADGRLVGMLPRERISRIPAERWATVKAVELMIVAERIRPLRLDDDGAAILQRLDAEDLPALPVVDDAIVMGVVTRSTLMQQVQRQAASFRPA